ncbi:MAG: NADH-quinone oxidoreductase subunit J [Phycisphaerales bacterium]
MSSPVIYLLSLVGAAGLFLLLRRGNESRRDRGLRAAGVLLGLGTVVYLILQTIESVAGEANRPGVFFIIFAAVAVISAGQMISTRRPVYSALHFVMVVIASAGLLLMAEAEFIAFALIIVYAGAILITYMFVLMLAQQAPDPDDEDGIPEYDRFAREPLAGAIVGFVLIALITRTTFDGAMGAQPRIDTPGAFVESWTRLTQMPGRLEEVLAADGSSPELVRDDAGRPVLRYDLTAVADLTGSPDRAAIESMIAGSPGITLDRVQARRDVDLPYTLGFFSIDADVAAEQFPPLGSAELAAAPGETLARTRFALERTGLVIAGAGGVGFKVQTIDARAAVTVDGATEYVRVPGDARPDNIQSVGLALITEFPASLEIAGVILLMAMFGAVILARRQIELTEDEKRAAAGLRRLGEYDYDEADDGGEPRAAGDPA